MSLPAGKIRRNNRAVAHNQRGRKFAGCSIPMVREVVVTETLNGEAVLVFRFTLDGSEQIAPAGAPVQLKDAVPLKPAPPMVSL